MSFRHEPGTFTAPDLENGQVVNGDENANRWMTEIQCVLRITGEHPKEFYLSQECRAEHVPFSATHQGAAEIFFRHPIMEFLTYSEEDRFRLIPGNDLLLGPHEYRNPVGDIDKVTFNPDSSNVGVSEIRADERSVVVQSLPDLLDGIRAGTLSVRSLYQRVRWQADGVACELFSPCRYVNFPDSSDPGNAFLQSISGQVLFARGDDMVPAYVACAVNGDGQTIVEFCCRRFRNVLLWYRDMVDADENLKAAVGNLAKAAPILTPMYDGIVPVDGGCDFFTYV